MLGWTGFEGRGITWRWMPSRKSVLHLFDALLIRCFEPDGCSLQADLPVDQGPAVQGGCCRPDQVQVCFAA